MDELRGAMVGAAVVMRGSHRFQGVDHLHRHLLHLLLGLHMGSVRWSQRRTVERKVGRRHHRVGCRNVVPIQLTERRLIDHDRNRSIPGNGGL